MFAEEKPHLLPLPLEPFRYYQYGERVVHLDGCVEVEAAYYGLPPGWIGRSVKVQWDALHVRILHPSTSQLPTGRGFGALSVNPENPLIVYLGVQGFGPGHLFWTDDGGGRWSDVTPQFANAQGQLQQLDTPVNGILIDPNHVSDTYIATDIGVFVSTDGGSHWRQYGSGLPRSAILGLKMASNRNIVAATHGRGGWSIGPLDHEFVRPLAAPYLMVLG
jgi:ligand-binding sensor domain-containing protein